MELDFVHLLSKDYEHNNAKLSRLDTPPWARRKDFEIARSTLEPLILRDLSVLKVCSPGSVYDNRKTLISHFHEIHCLSYEMAETWILYFVTKESEVLNRYYQIDGAKFFDDINKTASFGGTPSSSYRAMRSNIENDRSFVNLHIGGSATKQDVRWIVDNLWDSEVRSKVESNAFTGRIRHVEVLRRFIHRYLRAQGIKPKEINAYCEEILDKKRLDDSSLRKPAPELTYDDDILYEARCVLGKHLGKQIRQGDLVYTLTSHNGNKDHFTLVK